MNDELYDRLLSVITDEELENLDIHFSVISGIPSLTTYEIEDRDMKIAEGK